MHKSSTLTAWVDESMHDFSPSLGAGFYVLAATVVAREHHGLVRERMLGLVKGRASRLHWRDESSSRRAVIAETIAGLPVEHVVAIGSPLNLHRQERARRLCLEWALSHLDGQGVAEVFVETRQEQLDRRDIKLLDAARSKRWVSSALRMDFLSPQSEPLLWAADAVAGAVGAALTGRDPVPRNALGASVTEICRDL
ncbi:MAG: hypothetical protein QM621_01655 [Aeromicrobium sp.]|uniref:hypothetical protein n=1 Tax=Aeromicrobium sp. TaxID=1871063 RepID=UPI0039E3975A